MEEQKNESYIKNRTEATNNKNNKSKEETDPSDGSIDTQADNISPEGSTNSQESIHAKKSPLFTFKKLLVVLAILYVGQNIYKTVYKPKDPAKNYINNAVQLNDPFNVTIYLKDKYRRSQRLIMDDKQLRYNYDISNQVKFNITLTDEEFQDIDYLSVVPVISYKNSYTQNTETSACESGLIEELEERKSDSEGSMKGVVEKHNKGEKSAHLRTTLFFHLIVDENERAIDEDPILNYMYFRRNEQRKDYQPFLDCTQYWVLRRDKKPIQYMENTNPTIQITLDTYWWYRFTWVMNFYIAEQQTNSLLHDSSAFEEIKNILSDNSYSYLTLLFSVNLLHSLFSFLSVKNKVSFWKNVNSSEGISKQQYYLDFVFQIIIVFYLIDNEASFMLIIFTVIETLVSLWIMIRLLKFERRSDGKFPYYRIKKEQMSANEEKTVEYDRTATKFMSMILMPILFGYTGYSFYYRGNMGLYSFFLKTLVSFIYAIGFINMTPQIYINYKFKSVERLPWKAMVYQFLNTIVDDLFAFAVKMPTLQRISVFRDDVIFVIYLYQYWIYRNNKYMMIPDKKEE